MVSSPEEVASTADASTAAVEQAVNALSLTGSNVSENLRHAVTLLQKSVKQKETRLLTGRLLRQTAAIRKQLTREAIVAFLAQHLPAEDASRIFLESQLEQADGDSAMAVDSSTSAASTEASGEPVFTQAAQPLIPEVELYAYLLALLLFTDQQKFELAKSTAVQAMERLSHLNRRTLDVISARIVYYYSLSHEHTGSLESVRSTLLRLHCSAVLRHDSIGQETLMNLLLRNYLHYSLYDQAEKFRSKAQKSDQFRSNAQYSRYLYYLGKIRTVQLEYTDAKECLQQASARTEQGLPQRVLASSGKPPRHDRPDDVQSTAAPPARPATVPNQRSSAAPAGLWGREGNPREGLSSLTSMLDHAPYPVCLSPRPPCTASRKAPAIAHAFRITVAQWLVMVRLLLGEIPLRSEFTAPGTAAALAPFYELAVAVRAGDTLAFAKVARRHDAVFRAAALHNLVTRLHHNVIRTGLRRISLAYSRISLADVAQKLHLSSVEDAECIVAKAIRDGGIEAVLDHEASAMTSRTSTDIYSTAEPQTAFHARIAFCMDLHNEAVKAMRFEPDAHRRKLESAEARKERVAQEQELAKAIAEDGDDGDF
ncbi:MAG: hypothetical protein WDW38_010584 [Sanguina aurantia]